MIKYQIIFADGYPKSTYTKLYWVATIDLVHLCKKMKPTISRFHELYWQMYCARWKQSQMKWNQHKEIDNH